MKWLGIFFILLSSLRLEAQTSTKASDTLVFKPRPKGEVVTEAAAQAGAHVVTSREVIISYIMDEAMSTPIKKGASPDRKNWQIDVKSDAYAKHLAQILLEVVVQLEAENFSIGQVSPSEVSTFQKQIEEQVAGWEPWQRLEVSTVEMQQTLMRKLRAKNFLKFKMESSGVQISDDEARSFYEKNRVKFGNLPFAQFKDSIKEVLAQNQLQDKLKDWFDILKRKYRVRYLGASNS
jgi:hypothetical protein